MNRAHRRRDKRQAKAGEPAFNLASTLERGLEHHRAGRLSEARRVYEQVLHQDSDNARALFLLGTLALQQRDYEAGESLIRRAIAADSSDASYHNNLGVILRESGRLEDALQSYREAIELRPEYAEAHCNLGTVLRELEEYEDAVVSLERAIEIDPLYAGAYGMLGSTLQQLGRFAEALTAYDNAISLDSENQSAHFNRAMSLQEVGDLVAAQEGFRSVLRLQPQHAEAWRFLSGIKRFTSAEDKDVKAMSRHIQSPAIVESDSMHLHFGLGKALTDAGEIDLAYEHFAKANAIYRSTYEYDIAKDAEYFESIKRNFSAQFMLDREGWGCELERPIFIIGMMRSGTSLVEQILASHPQVVGCGELKEMDRLTRQDKAKPDGLDYPGSVTKFDRETANHLGQAYIQALSQRASASGRTTDKMPGNFQYVGLIRLLLPKATIIHCVRSPVDTCFSCFRNYFAGFHPFAYDLGELGRYYRLYQGLMDHWRSVVPDQLHDICYEELVSSPEDQIRRLLEICGLDWDDQCLEFHQTERSVRTASAAQVRRPIYTSSVDSWRKFEGHLGPLLESIG